MEQEEIFNREVKSLQRLLEKGDVEEIRKLRQTKSFVDLASSSSNLITCLMSFLDDKHLYRCSRIIECYEELFKIIIDESDALDMFITLMEQIDEDTCSLEKFVFLLKPMKLALLKLSESRKNYLEWTFSVIESYLLNLSPPEDHEIEFDEKKMLTNDPYIVSILFLVDNLMNFHDSFIENTISRREVDVLVVFAFHLLAEPAMFVYLEKFQELEQKYRSMVVYIDRFSRNTHYLLACLNERHMTHAMYDEKQSLTETDNEEETKDKFNLEDRISPLHLALYYYVKLNDEPMSVFPCVYDKLYLFHKLLFLCNSLTQHTHNAVTRKGLLMGERLLRWIEDDSIPRYFLELKVHEEFVRIVTKVSVFSYIFENRRTAVKLFQMYVYKFDAEGTYALYLNIWRATCNADIDGEVITSFRKRMYTNFLEGKLEYYQKGKLLIDLLKVFGRLENGTDTNLMECKNKVISFLHLLALIIRRDRANLTTIHDHFEYFENNYFAIIKTAVKKCREAYKQKANVLMNSEEADSKIGDKLNIVVEGKSLPRLKKEEKIMATKNALTALNVIENALDLVYDYANRKSHS